MFVLLILMFIFGIGFFVLAYVIPIIYHGLETGGLNNTPEARNAISTFSLFGTRGMQTGFLLLFIGLIIASFISSFLVRQHPMFLFLNIIFLVILVVLTVYFANTYETFINQDVFSSMSTSQQLITGVMQHSVLIMIIVGVLDMIIMYSQISPTLVSESPV